ncbi:unnamed protein product [Protopolystoma xenopodis]|uniref:Uncharacterized protein n=1 Tax=Protopolystoma xenopodis TaxID=117903 RepID=A0A3S5FGZ8_9PLAT|nr:unnamed protein product [Protopolystoma xenopodis]
MITVPCHAPVQADSPSRPPAQPAPRFASNEMGWKWAVIDSCQSSSTLESIGPIGPECVSFITSPTSGNTSAIPAEDQFEWPTVSGCPDGAERW